MSNIVFFSCDLCDLYEGIEERQNKNSEALKEAYRKFDKNSTEREDVTNEELIASLEAVRDELMKLRGTGKLVRLVRSMLRYMRDYV